MLKLVIIMWLITPNPWGEWVEIDRYETKGECWEVALHKLAIKYYGPNAAIQCLYENETP